MDVVNFLLLLLLLLISISATAVDRVMYTPGRGGDTNNTSPMLLRRDDTVIWGPDDETQDACDSDQAPQKTEGSDFSKLDCWEIFKFNQRFGRYTIIAFTGGNWAKINVKDTYCVAVARKDSSVNDFEVGDMDIRDVVIAAINVYSDPIKMKSVTGEATCDAADKSGNDVSISWKFVDPDDLA